MNEDRIKLEKELKFIEDSFKAGIVTKSEYENAKQRVADKLANIKDEPKIQDTLENSEPIKEDQHTEPEVETYHETSTDEDNVRLQTYGQPKKKNKGFIITIIILVLIILFLSFNSNNSIGPDEKTEEIFTAVCSADLDCQKSDQVGVCLNPEEKDAECIYESAVSLNITVVSSEKCILCDTNRMKNSLKQIYPGAEFIDIDLKIATNLITKLDVNALPAYIFDKKVEETKRFSSTTESTKSSLIKSGNLYLMKPAVSGSSYFFKNPQRKNIVRLFFSPYFISSVKAYQNIIDLLDIYDFDLEIIYYVRSLDDPNIEEIYRELCIREYSKEKLLSYLDCFLDTDLSVTESLSCIDELDIPQNILSCSTKSTLRRDLILAKDFSVNSIPTFIFNNQYKKGGSLSVDILEDVYCQLNEC